MSDIDLKHKTALTSVAQWIEHQAVNWKVAGCWFNSQSGHRPGFRARSPVGGMQEATNRTIDASLSLSPSLPLSLKINK